MYLFIFACLLEIIKSFNLTLWNVMLYYNGQPANANVEKKIPASIDKTSTCKYFPQSTD